MTVYRRPDPIPRHAAPQPASYPLGAVREDSASLTQLVARRIFSAIDEGRFVEGSILPNEQMLAAELGVSRTALREAVTALSAKGLLEARRRRGTMVLPRSRWNMLDADIITWSRRDRRDDISSELWQAAAVVLPGLAARAAERRAGGRLPGLARTLAAAVKPADATPARLEFVLELASLGRNRFLASVVSASLHSLLRDDPAMLDAALAGIDADTAFRVVDAIATGRPGEAQELTTFLLSRTTVEQRDRATV